MSNSIKMHSSALIGIQTDSQFWQDNFVTNGFLNQVSVSDEVCIILWLSDIDKLKIVAHFSKETES